MADDSNMVNGEFVDAQTVDIAGEEISGYESKVAELSEMIEALEKEKQQVVYENKTVNDRIEKMKESMKHLSSENEELKGQVEKLGSESKALQSVAARAGELEGEVSRLQHDLISAMSDLDEANSDVSKWKTKVESLENGATEKSIKLDAVISERDLLIGKVEDLKAKVGEKEKEIKVLEGRIEELKLAASEREELLRKVRELEGKLEEKERVINGLEVKQREVDGLENGKVAVVEEDVGSVVEGREKNCAARLKGEWPVVAVSAVSAVALTGVLCYLHYKKR
ncbi:peroxisomal and mitochondrial division factor 2-like [Coffea eugenioides]|uniref:peroxisomal and mitochondrial division factor 2-like n=1 Tax=Coffea eugenioides TaxID=49369 RepID=UPI000F6124EC|nr:peroxisomal and mitochondrial division factor 2-like [Coffea eugenioides]